MTSWSVEDGFPSQSRCTCVLCAPVYALVLLPLPSRPYCQCDQIVADFTITVQLNVIFFPHVKYFLFWITSEIGPIEYDVVINSYFIINSFSCSCFCYCKTELIWNYENLIMPKSSKWLWLWTRSYHKKAYIFIEINFK